MRRNLQDGLMPYATIRITILDKNISTFFPALTVGRKISVSDLSHLVSRPLGDRTHALVTGKVHVKSISLFSAQSKTALSDIHWVELIKPNPFLQVSNTGHPEVHSALYSIVARRHPGGTFFVVSAAGRSKWPLRLETALPILSRRKVTSAFQRGEAGFKPASPPAFGSLSAGSDALSLRGSGQCVLQK